MCDWRTTGEGAETCTGLQDGSVKEDTVTTDGALPAFEGRVLVEPGRRARYAALGFHRVVAIADRVVRRDAAVLARVPRKEPRVDDADVHPTAGVAGGVGELRADREHAVVAQELRCAPTRRVAEPA